MNKKGFTLVELLAVIAILAILVIIALPNVLKMYNNAKKNSFLTEAKTLARDVSSKYITESMKGNKLTTISNKQNSLDLSGRNIEYNFELDSQGKIKRMMVYDGTYCVVTTKDYTNLKTTDISDKCSHEELYNIVGTLSKNFYEKSGKTDRNLVKSIEFYSDGRTIEGANSYDVSKAQDKSIIMYIKENSENSSLLDLTIVAKGIISFPEDSSKLFTFNRFNGSSRYSNLTSIQFNHSVDTSKVTDMSYMFYITEKSNLKTLELSDFDTSNVITMSYMFDNSTATEIKGLEKFNTSKVTNMSHMFLNSKATTLDLSSFDTSKVTDMGYMFTGSEATEIKGLNKFNTSNVTNMGGMFGHIKVKILDLSKFDTSKVTDMGYMFNSSETTEIKGLNKFNTSNVTYMSSMFESSKATTLDLSNFDTSNVTGMYSMFSRSEVTTLDLSSFDTSKVTDMRNMFYGSKVTTLDLSSFDTSKVTKMGSMFNGSEATEIKGLEKFNTSNVTDMGYMFAGSKVTTVNLSSFDTSKVTYMRGMFASSKVTTLDLSSFDTSNVTDINLMFWEAKATTGYARTQADADKFNASSNKPRALTFTVK